METTIETLDRLLEAELDIQRKFRAIIYESRQGERTDLITSGSHRPKLDLSERQQKTVRAAERAAEAIPEVGELLDRGLINIDIAAKLGRQIKDPDNLTAEEREYINNRMIVGEKIKQYINTNTIPEDEDKEPAYRRELNRYVKDQLGIRNRSKSIRIDNPRKAAEKLLKFYEGQKLEELLEYLGKGANQDINSQTRENAAQPNNGNTRNTLDEKSDYEQDLKSTVSSSDLNGRKTDPVEKLSTQEISENCPVLKASLTLSELAERLDRKPRTIRDKRNKGLEEFIKWTKQKDPDGVAWQRSEQKEGKSYLFFPVKNTQQSNKTDLEASSVTQTSVKHPNNSTSQTIV